MAIQLIQNEWGIRFVMGVSFDMSGETDLQFHFIKPDCVTEFNAVGVLGTTQITIETHGILAANTWAYYDFLDGDLDQASDDVNKWRVDLRYQGTNTPVAAAQLFSEPASFDVAPAMVVGTP
jgi:hypothetical protein